MMIIQGLGGPKLIPKGVSDGQQVNIPAPLYLSKKVTQSRKWGVLSDLHLSFVLGQNDPIDQVAEKSLFRLRILRPYRKPTQVDWRKCAKVNE